MSSLEPTYRLPAPETIAAQLGGPMGSRDAANRLRKSIQKAWDRLKAPQQALVGRAFGTPVAAFLHAGKTAGKPDTTEIDNFVKLVKAFEAHGTADLTIHPGYQAVRPANDAELKNLTTMIST